MRTLLLAITLLLTSNCLAAEVATTDVHAYRDNEITLTDAQRQKIADWAVAFLKTANFNTASKPDVLQRSVQTIQENYRATVRKNYLVVTFPRPTEVQTVVGKVMADEIIVGLNRADEWPSALFTVDPEGRIVQYEKYAAPLPAELPPEHHPNTP